MALLQGQLIGGTAERKEDNAAADSATLWLRLSRFIFYSCSFFLSWNGFYGFCIPFPKALF